MSNSISISYYDNNRKSSCATIMVPPTSTMGNNRKSSVPLRINCGTHNPDSDVFYDTGSKNDISPTTVVSSRRDTAIFDIPLTEKNASSSFLSSIKGFPNKVLRKFKVTNTGDQPPANINGQEKPTCYLQRKLGESSCTYLGGKVARHSYNDPHLSPGSTAVSDDEERNAYFGSISSKKKKSTRACISAILMIIFGTAIAVTFVLVGFGKTLGGNINSGSKSAKLSATTSAALPTFASPSTTITSFVSPSIAIATITVTKALNVTHTIATLSHMSSIIQVRNKHIT